MDSLMIRKFLLFLVMLPMLAVSASVFSDVLTLKDGHPETHVVKKGDTLWDISSYFLDDPWLWPKLWQVNPQVANPHLIYPGDKLTLVFIDGQPQLVVKPQLRKSPKGYIQSKDKAIPAVNLSLIRPYLIQNQVVNSDWLAKQPIVVGGDNASRHYVVNDYIYVDGELTLGEKVGIYSQGRIFRRQGHGEQLGQEIVMSATGQVVDSGRLSKIKLLNSVKETKTGFKVLTLDDTAFLSAYFMPKASKVTEPSYVLASGTGISEMGKLDVVYIDRGKLDGVTTGDVFAIYRDGKSILLNNQYAKLPDIFSGDLMVFKVFEKTSLGLIMTNDYPVRVENTLRAPSLPLLEDKS